VLKFARNPENPLKTLQIMKPKKTQYDPQGDLFKPELCRIVDVKHPLVKLGRQIDWKTFDEYFDQYYAEEGRPAIETRLMVALHYLKYTYDLSDEDVVAHWKENPYWQYFSGRQFYEYADPIDPTSMTRWRKRIGEAGAQKLLKETVLTGIRNGHIRKSECKKVNVDTTVQTKAIRFPTDARLYNRMRERLVKQCEQEGLSLRQKYTRVGKKALQRFQNYNHARQRNRAKKQLRFLKTILGRVVRDVERKASSMSACDARIDQESETDFKSTENKQEQTIFRA
jgi:IS5 family transposase